MSETMTSQPSMKYLENKVLTSSPGHLVVLVLELAAKSLNQGQHWIITNRFDRASQMLCRAQECLELLKGSLDNEGYPQIANPLSAIYTQMIQLIIEANLRKDPVMLEGPIELAKELLSTWEEAVVGNAGKAPTSYGIQA